MKALLTTILSDPLFLWVWGAGAGISLVWLGMDLKRNNSGIPPLMKTVWALTVLYSGPIGLMGYYFSGRRQISEDTLWRRGFRSTAHCYSGCGAGEMAGVLLAAGFLAMGNIGVSAITFILAYIAGFSLTVGPLVQGGVGFKTALWDAFASESASITVMEVTAIAADLGLAAKTRPADPLFWSSLIFSLSVGLAAAYPVNVLLVKLGVKKGMKSPADHA